MAVYLVQPVCVAALVVCLAMVAAADNRPADETESSRAGGNERYQADSQCQSLVYLPQDSNSGDIVISEFMANPQTAIEADGEWIELYNTTSMAIDIDGWILQDSRGSHVIGRAVAVPPRGYIVISRAGSAVNGLPVARPTSYVYGAGISLANSGDSITLLNGGGKVVANIEFGPELAQQGCSAQLSGEQVPVFSGNKAGVVRWCAGLLPIPGGFLGRGSPAAANRFCPSS